MKLYFICGKARSGKDTIAQKMKEKFEEDGKKVCLLKITAPLNELLKDYFHWNGKEETKPRDFMQKIGYDIIHEKLGKKTFFLDILDTKIEVLNPYFDVGIITDGRLLEEIEYLKAKYKTIEFLHILRPDIDNGLTEDEKKHITETDLDQFQMFDHVIFNDKNLLALDKISEEIVRRDKNE